MDLSGAWKGYYEYGEGYYLPYFGERVKIEVVLSQSTNKIKGTSNELESSFSVPLKGTINGVVKDDIISFEKVYPVKPVISNDSKKKVEFKKGELVIIHEGVIDSEFNSIYGYWYIKEILKDDIGEYESILNGIWLLRKQKKQ